ncbi:MAG: DUF4091 domain-containing protein [Candidatus Sigynarchaeota archaeon]
MSTITEKLLSPHHDVVEKGASIASLSVLLAFIIKLGAIYPFVDSDLTSNAALVGVLVSIIVPVLACMITGPFWIHDVARRTLVQLATACFAFICSIIYIVDITAHAEWMGAPFVQQLGLHYAYSFYPVMVYFSSVFSTFLVSGSGLFTSSLVPAERNRNAILIMALMLVGVAWVDIGVLAQHGPAWSLLVEAGIHGAMVAVHAVQAAGIKHDIAMAMAAGAIERRRGIDALPAIIKNGRNGALHAVRGGITFIAFLLLILGTGIILVNVLIKASLVPLWLEFSPALMATAVAWGLFYKAVPSRHAMLFGSTAFLAITAGILYSDPYALLDHAPAVTWLAAATFSGVLLSCMLHARSMAIGRFSQPFWGFGTKFFIAGGLLVAMIVKWDYFCTECFQIALYAGLLLLALLAVAKVLGLVPAFWNKGKRELQARGVVPEYATFSVVSDPARFPGVQPASQRVQSAVTVAGAHVARAPDRARLVKAAVVLAVIAGIAVTGTFAGLRVASASTEHVLGSFNTDYYLWHADSLRSIDANYLPDLPSSPVTSTVRIAMARGEHEGFQVVLTPWRLKSLNVMSLAPTVDLVLAGSPADRIGKGNITTFIVDYVPQLAYQYPDRLLPFKAVDTSFSLAGSGRQNWPFYIDVKVPADDAIKPGIYRTTMLFHCQDYHGTPPGIERAYINRDVSFNLEVEVFNFTVPVERHVATEIIWGIPDTPAWHDFYAEHRLDWYFSPRAVTAVNTNISNGPLSITFDWPAYLAQLDAAFARGMKYFPVAIGNIPGLAWGTLDPTDDEKTVFSWYLGNLTAYLSNHTTPWNTTYLEHAYYFIQDEPAPEMYPGIIRVAQLIHAHAPGLKVMETMNQDFDTYPDAFLADVDIYCFHIHRWEPSATLPEDGFADGWPARIKTYLDTKYNATGNATRGKELWVYHTHNHFPTTDTDIYMQGILQRNSFWLHWTYGVPGWLYWTFNWGLDGDIGGYGYAYFGEGTLVGWGENGNPVGSLRLERVRDGIEDYEYFWLLNSTLAALDGTGHPAEAAAARALLARVDGMYNEPGYLQRLPLAGSSGDEPSFRWAYEPMAAPYMQLRHEIGVLLGQIAALGVI